MSIGFTIPVVMLCNGPVSDARSIGMIVVCFGKRISPSGAAGWLTSSSADGPS